MIDSTLFESIAAGATVMTANKRLSRELQRRYDQWRVAAGDTVWSTPLILSFDAWVSQQAHRLDVSGTVLADAQSQWLWEEIVAVDDQGGDRDLLQVAPAARRAREAYRLLGEYRAEFTVADADADHLAFLRWRNSYRDGLKRNGWLARDDLLAIVTSELAAGRGSVSTTVILAGFDVLTPALSHLVDVLTRRGCRVDCWQPQPIRDTRIGSHCANDLLDEVRSCARWARRWLEREPQARIGVVAPHLTEYQGLIEEIFRAELDPPACLTVADGPESFSLSLGAPLAREGVVRAALRLLAVGDPLPVEEIGWLLRSPYLAGAGNERLSRAATDRALRERGRREWPLAALSRAVPGTPRMALMFDKLCQDQRDRRRRPPGAWAECFARRLDSCGWPGDRGLSSREFQAVSHFRSALGQLASLDLVARALERAEALAILGRLTTDTVFQPEGAEGRVQVMGMLEAAGFDFTALWLLGLHDGAFPSPARPNPFIPFAMQSRLRMPHADAAREREFAEGIARRLFVAAPEVVLSWPGQHDGAALRPSPLLRGVAPATIELAPCCDPFQATQAAPCLLDSVVDDRAMPVPADRPFAGGTNILKDQALCPFRAFAHHRLHAERLEAPDLGLDNLVRGQLVHGVLERFWRQIGSHDALLQLDRHRLESVLAEAAEESLRHHERRSRCDLPQRLRAIESCRLQATASVWLELERQRPPFRVAEIEQRHDARVGRLQLRTRIDRIDELPSGQLAVIDYKTGRPDPGQWLDRRVTEPQLPLYCLDLDTDRIEAVLFAVVRNRSRECAFKGVARDPQSWPRLSAKAQDKLLSGHGWNGLDEVVSHWRKSLPVLGDAFVDGVAAVDPVDPRQACSYCDLVTLCRIGDLACDSGDGAESGDE